MEEANFDGNTPLHLAAASDNETIVKYLLKNGASSTQFMKNNDGLIPLEVSKNNTDIFNIILLDFLNYALKLKELEFSDDAFQDQLGNGSNLFCLKRNFGGNKTLFEFLYDQGLVKEREELIQLLVRMDRFRYDGEEESTRSERRVINILRAGMDPSRGLKESIDSAQDKYPWTNGKVLVNCAISVVMCLLGLALYAFDIASDGHFYSTLDHNYQAARITTLVHIILPLAFSVLLFLTLLISGFFHDDWNWYLLLKIPLPPFTKLNKTIIECQSFINHKRKGDDD